MVLGIRSKSRKSVSVQVHYIIHVQVIKPWPPSEFLRSAQSLQLQWEDGNQNSGSLSARASIGKIEFNESFTLSVLLWQEASKKGKHRESFQKSCLEFQLYDKTVKSQLVGSATINLAEFGIIKETKALSTQLNIKKSFKSSAQPFLYVNIQPFDVESSSSSPNSRLSKELSVDKEESESASQSVNDDELEIASFTDDDGDDDDRHSKTSHTSRSDLETINGIRSKTFQTGIFDAETNTDIRSKSLQTSRFGSETTGDSTIISKGEIKGSSGELVLALESDTSRSPGNREGKASTYFNGIESPSSSTFPSSSNGNTANGRPPLRKIVEESVKVTDSRFEIPEVIQQPHVQNITPDEKVKARPPTSYISSSMQFERSSQSQGTQDNIMTQEDSIKDQRYNKDGPENVSSVSKMGFLDCEEKAKERRKEQRQFIISDDLVDDFSDEESTGKGLLDNATLLQKKSRKNPEIGHQSHEKFITEGDMVKTIPSASNISPSSQPNFERSSQSQVAQEEGMTQEDSTKDQIAQRQFIMRNDLVKNFSDGESAGKGLLDTATLLLRKKSHENSSTILIDDKADDVITVKSPSQSAKSKSQTLDQAEKINNSNDADGSTACHGDINVNRSFIYDKTELKAEVEMLREELREAAALEASLYSVIAEHGSSSNKVHAPARRLSRFYFHACKVGSAAMKASAARSAVSGFVLVSKACGNDVPRLTFWFSNLILLRSIVSNGVENLNSGFGGIDHSLHEEEKGNTDENFHTWEDPETFLVALEKVEAWIFSRIVESVWWQTLTPYMQSAAAKSSSARKIYGKRQGIGDEDQVSFSVDLWKRAFKDACERLCPLRAGGHACGCLPVIARLVMEQLVNRLDVAMFNAILREYDDEMPTDPISDPISDPKVLPIPSGKSGFGAGAQLKNAIGDWSRWLSDLFGIDDSDAHEDSNENNDLKFGSSFKPFNLLNALSDLMMLPSEMLIDRSTRTEVCPRFGVSLIKRVVNNFVPDEFSPGPIPDAVFDALNDEDIEEDEGSITNIPCTAGSTLYAPPHASSAAVMLQEVGTQSSLKSGSFALRKLYTSDDELDELDSPFSALGMDDTSLSSKNKIALLNNGGRKFVRYELLREVWKNSE